MRLRYGFPMALPNKNLQTQRKTWLKYHARKTEGILSLLLACYDMPYRVTDSNGNEFKEYAIHNGGKCPLKGWHLSDKDVATLKEQPEGGTHVFQELPKTLFFGYF